MGVVVGGYEMQDQLTRLLSLQLVKTAELYPSRNYFSGVHPHGILAFVTFTDLCTHSTGFSFFPSICSHLTELNLTFLVPFLRDYITSGAESSHTWEDQGWRHEGGIVERVSKNVFPLRACIVEKETRPREALPTSALSSELGEGLGKGE